MNDHPFRNRFSTIAGLAAQAPHMYDLLHRIGLERRRARASQVARSAGWFGAGLAVGAGLSSLLSQGGGQQLRERLGEKARRVREYVAPVEQAMSEGSAQSGQERERSPYEQHTGSA
jgi:hypothetical protein